MLRVSDEEVSRLVRRSNLSVAQARYRLYEGAGHSTLSNEPCEKLENTEGLTKGGRTERKFSGNKLENVLT